MKKFVPRLTHQMDVEVATQVSKNAALVFHHIYTWIINNKVEEKNQINGKTWVYQTQKTMLKYMPYFTQDELTLALQKLVDSGHLVKENLSKNKWDKTSWYALPKEPELIDNPSFSNNSSDIRESQTSISGKARSDCISKESNLFLAKEKQANEKKVQKNPSKDACLLFSEEEEKLVKHIVSECNSLKLGITEKSIRLWSKQYTAKKVSEKIRLYLKRSKKETIRSVGGWITKALKEDYQDNLDTMELNRKFAENFKKKCKWLVIEKTGCYPEGTSKDFSFSTPHPKFVELLEGYYKSIKDGV